MKTQLTPSSRLHCVAIIAGIAILSACAAWASPPSFEYFGPPPTGFMACGESDYWPPDMLYGAGPFVVSCNPGPPYSTPIPVLDLQSHPNGVAENLHDVACGLGKIVVGGNAVTIIQSAGAFHLTLSEGIEDSYTLQSTADFMTWTNVMTLTNDGVDVPFALESNGLLRFCRAVTLKQCGYVALRRVRMVSG